MTNLPYEFQSLLDDFADSCEEIRRQANRHLDPSDFARYGFAQTAVGFDWSAEQQRFIDDRCHNELSDESLSGHGDALRSWRAFNCLALGYLLGLYQTEQIADHEFSLADSQLSGFMFLNSPIFDTF
ncbi:hypothetical protein CA13_00780 [Planctomycetes bacterium CA13]|uniref:Uncharacterized protein n=1 Tax=Novipirellula herctigrandis TaxID=2527986 RepID=A0A5C5YUG8_9BACT|nr:hypothetical protein CA13_00780 [Planctomycetes bacterium CA13]